MITRVSNVGIHQIRQAGALRSLHIMSKHKNLIRLTMLTQPTGEIPAQVSQPGVDSAAHGLPEGRGRKLYEQHQGSDGAKLTGGTCTLAV